MIEVTPCLGVMCHGDGDPLRVRRRPSTSESCLGAARACAETSRDNLHVSVHGRAADHLTSPKVVAFSRPARLGLPVRAPLHGRPFQVPEVRLARVTLLAASGQGSRLNAAFSAANAAYPRSGCRGHAWEASRARGATFRCCRPSRASHQAGGAPQYAALGDRLCVPSRSGLGGRYSRSRCQH
jgi:hypothetical protein